MVAYRVGTHMEDRDASGRRVVGIVPRVSVHLMLEDQMEGVAVVIILIPVDDLRR